MQILLVRLSVSTSPHIPIASPLSFRLWPRSDVLSIRFYSYFIPFMFHSFTFPIPPFTSLIAPSFIIASSLFHLYHCLIPSPSHSYPILSLFLYLSTRFNTFTSVSISTYEMSRHSGVQSYSIVSSTHSLIYNKFSTLVMNVNLTRPQTFPCSSVGRASDCNCLRLNLKVTSSKLVEGILFYQVGALT